MSDGTSELTASTTESIASEVYDSFEPSEPTETPSETPVVADSAPTETPGIVQTPPKPLTEAEKLLHAEGFQTERREDGRENRIPYSKVRKIIENGINQGKGEFGQKFQALETEATGLRSTVERVNPILDAMDKGPEAMLAYAAQHDPRYKAYLEQKSAPAAAPAPLAFPEADLDLGNGSKTYSIEGVKQLVTYAVQQAREQAKEEAASVLKPITEREQRAEAETTLRTRTRETIAEAQTWPGFAEHEADILTALREDSASAAAAGHRPKLTLDSAYRQVVVAKLIQEDSAKRAKLLEEINGAAKAAPTVARSSGEVPSVNRTPTTHSIAAKVYDRMNSGA